LRSELGLARETRLLLAVGNLYPVKGHKVLLDAAARIMDRHPAVHLAIAGRGGLAGQLQSIARQYGIADRVHFLGLRSDVPSLLESADIFVMPSLSEGLPLALLEAMFAGRAIVATRVGEVPTALDGGDAGLVVEPGDAVGLATALDQLLSNPAKARQLGERAARRAADVYDVSHMLERYARIYGEILGDAA
jgi:glycosyltransferase involved in cell wall biosynthesis